MSILVGGQPYSPMDGIDVTYPGQLLGIKATARDFAGVFGLHMKDNYAELPGTLKVEQAGTVTLTWGGQVTVFHAPAETTMAPVTIDHSSHDHAPPVLSLFHAGKLVTRSSPYGQAVTKEKYIANLKADGHNDAEVAHALNAIIASEMHLAFKLGEAGKWTGVP